MASRAPGGCMGRPDRGPGAALRSRPAPGAVRAALARSRSAGWPPWGGGGVPGGGGPERRRGPHAASAWRGRQGGHPPGRAGCPPPSPLRRPPRPGPRRRRAMPSGALRAGRAVPRLGWSGPGVPLSPGTGAPAPAPRFPGRAPSKIVMGKPAVGAPGAAGPARHGSARDGGSCGSRLPGARRTGPGKGAAWRG